MPSPDEVRLRHIYDAVVLAMELVEGRTRGDLKPGTMLALSLAALARLVFTR